MYAYIYIERERERERERDVYNAGADPEERAEEVHGVGAADVLRHK